MENITMEFMGKLLFPPILTGVDYFFAIAFSSPAAGYCLSIFNYFSFSSIYVLLNVKVPAIVFNHFSQVFKSS